MTKFLIENGGNPLIKDRFGKTPMGYGLANQNDIIVHLFTELDIESNDTIINLEEINLEDAVDFSNITNKEIIRVISKNLKKQHEFKILYPSLICSAGYLGDLESIKHFNKSEIDLFTPDYDGRNCLHLAASNNQINTLTYLISHCNNDGINSHCLDIDFEIS